MKELRLKYNYSLRVYFSDTDAGGIVYHARYLDFAEHARTEALRSVFKESQSQLLSADCAFVVKSINISYEKPGYLDDLLTVETYVKEAKRFSAVFNQIVKREDEVLATLEVKVAAISLEKKRPIMIPEEIIKALSVED